MNRGYLSDYFERVGVKTLSAVDADSSRSHQREVGDGNKRESLKAVLGSDPRTHPLKNRFSTTYVWLNDEQETITEYGFLSWYDTRKNKPHREPEWRAYYQKNAVTNIMSEGDTLFIMRRPDDSILFVIVPFESSLKRQLLWLFDIPEQQDLNFVNRGYEKDSAGELDFVSRYLLDEIGVEYEDPKANTLDSIIERFGMKFPKTKVFSALARATLPEANALDNPDKVLMAWLSHEEAMFRRLEKRIVSARIKEGFVENDEADVDSFIKYSLSVQNRRKSRMGHSLENHLSAMFDAHGIRYASQVKTEKGKKPDYIFPGQVEYNNTHFPVEHLTMLAAKSSCKDRWPQVLPEAERLSRKHLLTLEAAIAESTTITMEDSSLQLIVPKSIQSSYTTGQQEWLWCLEDFLKLVLERQSNELQLF